MREANDRVLGAGLKREGETGQQDLGEQVFHSSPPPRTRFLISRSSRVRSVRDCRSCCVSSLKALGNSFTVWRKSLSKRKNAAMMALIAPNFASLPLPLVWS